MAASWQWSLDPKPSLLEPPGKHRRHSFRYLIHADEDDDPYGRLKSLQRQLEFTDIQEEYVKDEQKNLKRELLRAQVKRAPEMVPGMFSRLAKRECSLPSSSIDEVDAIATARF
ncbi:hypothetical protein J5N97_013896 [Dioscorea zingiberensis]|uniref:Uncharacterized protein n=1 Tax=Dioscorea zingiberensis TaxID=325984 RepID=A0A9D5HJI5_9LILI|nr:hypothetical protein J5N97_013896 [Dioscorea zingiberensis]